MLQIHDSAHGVLFATGELVYVQGMGNKPRGRRAAPFDVAQGRELVERGYWNNIQVLEVLLSAQKLPARLAGTLCYYPASKFFAAAKRAPWADNRRSCYYLTFYY